MAATILGIGGGLIHVEVNGRLAEGELVELQQALVKVIREQGPVRILVTAKDFEGWEKGADWDDMTLQEQYDPSVQRMAIVGDERWRDLTLAFTGQGLRPFPIRYFLPHELPAARAWLGR